MPISVKPNGSARAIFVCGRCARVASTDLCEIHNEWRDTYYESYDERADELEGWLILIRSDPNDNIIRCPSHRAII